MVNPVLDDSKSEAWRPRVFVSVIDPESPYSGQVGRVLKVTEYGRVFVLFEGAIMQFRLNQVRSTGSK